MLWHVFVTGRHVGDVYAFTENEAYVRGCRMYRKHITSCATVVHVFPEQRPAANVEQTEDASQVERRLPNDDESECQHVQPDGMRFGCELVEGHAGNHGAHIGSAEYQPVEWPKDGE